MSLSWTVERYRYQAAAEAVEPAARVTTKDGVGWRALWWAGAVLTLGVFALALPLRRFLGDFGTTVGCWLGFPRDLPVINPRFLRHECRHVTQFTWFGWAVPLLGWCLGRRARAVAGMLPMGVAYALLPLPAGLALGRYLLEADAEETSWRAGLRDGSLDAAEVRRRADAFGAMLAGREYLWAWPWAVRGLRRRAERLLREVG